MVLQIPRNIKGVIALVRDTLSTRHARRPYEHAVAHFVYELTGVTTRCPALYSQALTHASYQEASYDNERLEFLGDSVLSSIVGHAVYELYPEDDEGSLSQLRSYLVSRHRINVLACNLGFDKVIRVGGGIDLAHSDIVGNALEAFIGALFLDKGYRHTVSFVRKKLIVSRQDLDQSYEKEEDSKTAFIILMQKHKIPFEFVYTDSHTDESGALIHTCELRVGRAMQIAGQGSGTSKKLAHQDAARHALHAVRHTPSLLNTWIG